MAMALVDTEKDDRLGALRVSMDEARAARDQGSQVIALIGFPLDEGCRRNGGRCGAEAGPAMFRQLVWKTGCVPNFVTGCDFHNVRIVDCGDIDIDEYDEVDYDGARDALRQKVSQALSNGFIPFVIGGSNDQSYANACALLEHFPDTGLGVINLDAHLDVRPQKAGLEHSGSPFRQLLEDQRFCRMKENLFTEFACQSHQCAASHVRWILEGQPGRACQTRVVWLDHMLSAEPRSMADCFAAELETLADADAGRQHVFVSFDVDSIAAAFCPGVSCPSPIGLDAETALQCCLRAGMCKSVRLMDMSEFNPAVEDYNTGKLLATMFYNFVMGVSMRP